MLSEEAFDFERCFGVPAEHALRQSGLPLGARGRLAPRRWKHEEYARDGHLVAVYESSARDGDSLAFVKYLPHGWVLSISGRSPRVPPPKPRPRLEKAA